MKIALAIQARLGSSRLPQKVLLQMNNLAIVDHIIKQVQAITGIDEIVLTTSDTNLDCELVRHFSVRGLKSFTYPVDDIIGRLHGACTTVDADVLIRIWGDCIFVCPDVISDMLNSFINYKLEYMTNGAIHRRTFPPGLDAEIYSADLLRNMNLSVKEPALREFPIEFIKSSLGSDKSYFYQIDNFRNGAYTGQIPTDLHLTIDYPSDFTAATEIMKLLSPKHEVFTYPDLCRIYRERPELFTAFSQNERNKEYTNYLKNKEKVL